jgi:hypothetical protein
MQLRLGYAELRQGHLQEAEQAIMSAVRSVEMEAKTGTSTPNMLSDISSEVKYYVCLLQLYAVQSEETVAELGSKMVSVCPSRHSLLESFICGERYLKTHKDC